MGQVVKFYRDQMKCVRSDPMVFGTAGECIGWISDQRDDMSAQVGFTRYMVDDTHFVDWLPAEREVHSKLSLFVEMKPAQNRSPHSILQNFLEASPMEISLKCLPVDIFSITVTFEASQRLNEVSRFCHTLLDEVLNLRDPGEIELSGPGGRPFSSVDMDRTLGELGQTLLIFTFGGQNLREQETLRVVVVQPGTKFREESLDIQYDRTTKGSDILMEAAKRLGTTAAKLRLFLTEGGYRVGLLDSQLTVTQLKSRGTIRVMETLKSPVTVAILRKGGGMNPLPTGTVFQMEWGLGASLLDQQAIKKKISDYYGKTVLNVYLRKDGQPVNGGLNFRLVDCICAVIA
jgi:hypothetical protein